MRSLELLFEGEQPAWAVFGEALHRDAVHAAATCVGPHFFPSRLQGLRRIDFVDEAEAPARHADPLRNRRAGCLTVNRQMHPLV